MYETNFPDIMMESEILAELQSKPLPDNVHAAFLKTCYNFADKMGLKLNLREHKQTHSYCWSTSSSSNVFYVDMNLKTYRCTCTVGRSRYSLFDFSYENLTNYRPVAVTAILMRSVRIVKSVASAVADVSCPTKSISKVLYI